MNKYVAYSNTDVSAGRSRERIEHLFFKYGAQGFSFNTDLEKETILIGFRYRNKPVVLELNIRAYAQRLLEVEPWNSRRRCNRAEYEMRVAEQAYKGIYRAAETWLKATFEAIEFGLLNFETAFLPHFGHQLPNGQVVTIGRMLIPQLDDFARTGRLLPAPKSED